MRERRRSFVMQTAKGSYIGYFQRRGGIEDAERRLKCFPSNRLTNKIVLDIGCSSGEFTMLMAKKFKPQSVLGVDIDQKLIDTANNYLQAEKSKYLLTDNAYNANTKKRLVPRIVVQKPSIQTASKIYERKDYPYNVNFTCSTILDNSIDQGDSGLIDFFYRIHDLLKDNGFFILEYQPWSSYEHAVKNKRQEKIHQNYCQLSIRPEHFERILEDKVGFNIISREGPALSGAKGYNRPILIAQKQPMLVCIKRLLNGETLNQEDSKEKGPDMSPHNFDTSHKRNHGDHDTGDNIKSKRTKKSSFTH